MTTHSRRALREELDALLDEANVTFEEFLDLGQSGDLEAVSPLLDFVYKALLPALITDAA